MAPLILAVLVTMANDPSLTPAGAVRVFYDEVIKRHPLGIPTGEDKAAFWPLLSVRLARTLDTLQACENAILKGTADSSSPPSRPHS
jgi:hypothetical protein